MDVEALIKFARSQGEFSRKTAELCEANGNIGGAEVNAAQAAFFVAIANALSEGMHWLPMTPDAVFEDGGAYLVESVHDGLLFAVEYGGYDAKFHLPLDVIEPFSAKDITRYARITEPK